jgi:hypothetical protein
MVKRVMNVLTVLAGLTSILFFVISNYSAQVLLISVLILLSIVIALNYIFFSQVTIWHKST